MGSKTPTPSTPSTGPSTGLRQLPPTQAGGLRKNDGSLVPIQGTPFQGETFNQVPEQYREGFAEFMRNNPKYGRGGQAISYATLPDGNLIQFGDTGSASGFTEYLKTLNTPNRRAFPLESREATPIGGMPLPEGVQIGFGPIRGGYFYGDGTPYNPPGSLGRPLMGDSQDIRARRPINSPNFSGEKIIPTMEEFGATANLLPGVSVEEAYNNAFGPLAIQSPDSTAGIMSGLPQVPTPPGMGPGGVTLRPGGGYVPRPPGMVLDGTTLRPGEAMIPEQGPLGPGLVGGTAPSTGMPQPINQPPSMGPIPPGVNTQNPPAPIQPTNPVTGNTSPIGGSQQDFDAYLNSYVNDLINQRMKNVFGGIMNSFN